MIGTTFHRWVRDNAQHLQVEEDHQNLRFMTTEMQFFANAYQLILSASHRYTPGLEAVFYNAHNSFTLPSTVLLAPLNVGDDDATIRSKIAATATYLDIWIMRRAANYIRITYSSVAHTMWMLIQDIRRLQLNELVEVLKTKLDDDAQKVSFDGADSRGRGGLKALGVNQFLMRYIFHLLARVTGAHRYDQYHHEFDTEQQFLEWRDQVAGAGAAAGGCEPQLVVEALQN